MRVSQHRERHAPLPRGTLVEREPTSRGQQLGRDAAQREIGYRLLGRLASSPLAAEDDRALADDILTTVLEQGDVEGAQWSGTDLDLVTFIQDDEVSEGGTTDD
ncbi:hypothetical protein [Luteipulveratus halotolerans]|uniref:Uncharacterized protein n=1 Tax=Luteipulveratus halotolerans TaxID=1631356 RepID=A0A0L6CDL7_9MICO|nr:hypothetical protein VV01_21900 [Luteipulveratus halotolerans]